MFNVGTTYPDPTRVTNACLLLSLDNGSVQVNHQTIRHEGIDGQLADSHLLSTFTNSDSRQSDEYLRCHCHQGQLPSIPILTN